MGPGIIDYYQRISKFAVIGCNPTQVWLIYSSLLLTGLPSIVIGAVLGIGIGFLILGFITCLVFYALNSWVRTFTCGRVWCCDLDKCCQEINIDVEPITSTSSTTIADTANIFELPISNSILGSNEVKYSTLPSFDKIEMIPPPYE